MLGKQGEEVGFQLKHGAWFGHFNFVSEKHKKQTTLRTVTVDLNNFNYLKLKAYPD